MDRKVFDVIRYFWQRALDDLGDDPSLKDLKRLGQPEIYGDQGRRVMTNAEIHAYSMQRWSDRTRAQ